MRQKIEFLILLVLIAFALQGGGSDGDDVTPPTSQPHVLFVEENGTRGRLPSGQLAIIESSLWRDILDAKRIPWRVVDQDQAVNDEPWASTLSERDTASTPWFFASNGRRAKSGDLPVNVADWQGLMDELFE